jgi:hypothetical protein
MISVASRTASSSSMIRMRAIADLPIAGMVATSIPNSRGEPMRSIPM